jgi:hypothetical protein
MSRLAEYSDVASSSHLLNASANQLDSTFGRITLSPVVFNGADVSNYQITSFHPTMAGGADVIVVPAPSGTGIFFTQVSNNNCITADVN